MGLELFEAIFDWDALSEPDALELVLAGLDQHHITGDLCVSGDRVKVTRPSLIKRVKDKNQFPSQLFIGNLQFQYGGPRNWKHRFLMIREEREREQDWSFWVLKTLPITGFVLAWATDREFDFWQNAHDPLQYTANGRDYTHLPMIHNGSPPPLDRLIIDTTCNPGRRVLRDGYVEGIGHTMWLTPLFWQRTGRERNEAALSEAGWRVTTIGDGVLRLDVPKIVFTEQGDRATQERLRFALYGN